MGKGVILRAVSGFYYVEQDGETFECRARGKLRLGGVSPLVGDVVEITVTGGGQGVIEEVLPRRNAFVRPPVANIDQLVVIASAAPPVTDPYLIDRLTVIAAQNDCDCVVCINKADLDRGDKLFDIYTSAGFRVVRTSAVTGEGVGELAAAIEGKVSAFTGNSGVGKSSLLNRLEPGFDIAVGELSRKLGRGRHTTRHVELYRLKNGAFVADTPGFSAFDADMGSLAGPSELQHLFREFAPHIGKCRFGDCGHVREAGCAVLEAVAGGEIPKSRHLSYLRLYDLAKSSRPWEKPRR